MNYQLNQSAISRMRVKLKYKNFERRLSSKEYTLLEILDFAHKIILEHEDNFNKNDILLVSNYEPVQDDNQFLKAIQENSIRNSIVNNNSKSPAEFIILDKNNSVFYEILYKLTSKIFYAIDKTFKELRLIAQEHPDVQNEQISMNNLALSCNEAPIEDQETLDKIWVDKKQIKITIQNNKIDDYLSLTSPPLLQSQNSIWFKKSERVDYRNQSIENSNNQFAFNNEATSQILKSTFTRRPVSLGEQEEEIMRQFFSSQELSKHSQNFQLSEQETLKVFYKQFLDLYDNNQKILIKALKQKLDLINNQNTAMNIESAQDFLQHHYSFSNNRNSNNNNNINRSITKQQSIFQGSFNLEKSKIIMPAKESNQNSVIQQQQIQTSQILYNNIQSQQYQGSINQCENNKYSVKILNCESMTVNSEPKKLIKLKFKLENSGKTQWGSSTFLCNTQGEGDAAKLQVNSLKPGENQEIVAEIQSPSREGISDSSWRLFNGTFQNPQFFGPIIQYKIHVKASSLDIQLRERVLCNLIQIYPGDKETIAKHITIGMEKGQNEDQIYNAYVDFKSNKMN